GHDAAVMLELEEARPAQRRGDLLSMVEGGVVVAVRRVEASGPDGSGVAQLIADLRTLEVDAHLAVLAHFEIELEQCPRTAAEARGEKEVELGDARAMILGELWVVVADPDVGERVQRYAQILGVLRGAARELRHT